MKLRRMLLMVLAGVSLALGLAAAKALEQKTVPGLPQGRGVTQVAGQDEREQIAIRTRLLNLDYHMADLSLAVREQVDFLLTPALLVQEAVSDDVVLTYPEE